MLAGVRSRFLFSFLLGFSLVACLPVQAQVNGVLPSVTSIGFGGRLTNGVRPSVTSLGPNGNATGKGNGNDWFVFGNCCANLFSSNPNSSHHRRHRDHGAFAVGVIEPAYVPYAASDAAEPDDDSADADAGYSPAPPPPVRHAANRNPSPNANADVNINDNDDDEPVAAQPPTVLVFKDGHHSDVLNYAIVGDTLFDFAEGRSRKILLADLDLPATRKANDDRGVDFQIPAATTQP